MRGLRHCEMQGDINQQGGAFILGPGRASSVYLYNTRYLLLYINYNSFMSGNVK